MLRWYRRHAFLSVVSSHVRASMSWSSARVRAEMPPGRSSCSATSRPSTRPLSKAACRRRCLTSPAASRTNRAAAMRATCSASRLAEPATEPAIKAIGSQMLASSRSIAPRGSAKAVRRHRPLSRGRILRIKAPLTADWHELAPQKAQKKTPTLSAPSAGNCGFIRLCESDVDECLVMRHVMAARRSRTASKSQHRRTASRVWRDTEEEVAEQGGPVHTPSSQATGDEGIARFHRSQVTTTSCSWSKV